MSTSPLRLRRLSDPEALFELESRLETLATEQARPTPFSAVPYLHAVGSAAGDAFAFRTVWQDDTLVGLLPMVRERRVRMGLPVPRLRLAPVQPSLPGDWLLDSVTQQAVPAVVAALQADRDWADAYFTKLSADSPLVTAARQHGLQCTVVGGEYTTPLGASWEDLCGRLSSNRRRRIRRAMRLDQFGPAVTARIAVLPKTADDATALLTDLRSVLERSWKSADAPSQEQGELFLCATPGMLARERAVCFLLRLDDRPAAFLLLYRAGTHLYAVLNAHDPAAEAGSPGTVLIAAALRWACEQGFQALHFGNDTPYLRHWGGERSPYHAVRLFNTTARGGLLRAFSRRQSGGPAEG